MNTHLCRLAAVGLVVSAAQFVCAAPIPARSNVSAVTVYTDRAIVTRTAQLDLAAAGPAEVVFEKLPAQLVEQSLQVAGRGAVAVTILDVTARAAHVDVTPNERVKALEDELRALGKQRRVLDDRLAALKATETTLGKIETAATATPTKDSAPRLTIEESGKLILFLDENRGKVVAERQAVDTQVEELAAKIDATQRKLNELRGAGGRTYKNVTVRLEVAAAGKLELALSYAVPGANWVPAYDARVNSNEKSVALAYHGVVRQNTGEDWTAVALTLSTARPSLGGAAPEVRPWTLDVVVPRPIRPMAADAVQALSLPVATGAGAGRRKEAERAEREEIMYAKAEQTAVEAKTARATVEAAATSASFKVAAPATIPSDNSPQKVPITTAALATTPEYLVSPKLRPAAFLTAKVVNTSEFPLLAGAMNVFLDGTFVATSHLRTVMPGEKFELALGVDEGIAVKHKRVQRFTEDTGLTNSGKRITYEYLTTLQNNKRVGVRMIATDQIPVSRNEKVVVKQLAPEPKELKPAADGLLKWTFDLKPAEKRELKLKFTVEHPNDVQVSGLEP